METNNKDKSGRDDSPSPYRDHRDGSEETPIITASDQDISKKYNSDDAREESRQQPFGNGKYESRKNYSSTDGSGTNIGADFS